MDRIAFTGHRHLRFNEVAPALASIHAKYPDAIWITGGAIGLDSHAAEYAPLHGIHLWLILPFPPKVMTAKWNPGQVAMLRSHIAYCSKLSVLSPVYNMGSRSEEDHLTCQVDEFAPCNFNFTFTVLASEIYCLMRKGDIR